MLSLAVWMAINWLGLDYAALAQQSLRPSLSSPADQRRTQYAATGYDYNIKLGPTYLTLGTSLGLEYNDNINLADSRNTGEAAPKADFIYRPAITLHTIWPATKLNVLTIDLGLGVQRYLSHPEYNQTNITVSPNTQVSFDVYVGNVRLNFHDRLSISQNAATRADTSNTGPYSETTNTTGVSALWDLNKTILQAGFDYNIRRYTGTTYTDQNSSSNIFNTSISFPVASALTFGVQGNYILTTYVEATQPDITTASIGPFLQVSPSRYTHIQASAGFQHSKFTATDRSSELGFLSSESDSSQQGGSFYYSIALQNQLNRYFQQSLSLTKERELGLDTNLLETQALRYDLQWRINSRVTISTNAFYEIERQNTGFTDEKFNYYGGGISFGYQFTRHLAAGFHYANTQKASDLPFRNYSQNIIGLDLRYDF